MMNRSVQAMEISPMNRHDVPTKQFLAASQTTNPLEPTIFHDGWWLDIAIERKCQFAEVVANLKVVARLPYPPRKQRGLTFPVMPPLTLFLGPALVEGEAKDDKRF